MEVTAGGGRHAPQQMSKEDALRRARGVKLGFFWATLIGFVVLWQAAAHHLVGVTSRAATSSQTTNGSLPGSGSFSGTSGYGGSGSSYGSGYGFGQSSGQPLTQSTVS